MLYGAFCFWKNDPQCNALDERANRTFWETLLAIEQCDTWVAWVSVNAAFHGIWVFMLLICQLYQVSFYTLNKACGGNSGFLDYIFGNDY